MAIWSHNQPKLRNRLRKLLGNSDNVDDLLQDLFIKVYRNRHTFPFDSGDRYLMTAAIHIGRDYLRNRARRTFLDEIEVLDLKTPEHAYAVAEQHAFYRNVIEPALQKLPVEQRQALSAYCRGEQLTQSARSLGVSYSTFLSRRDSALRVLRHYSRRRLLP